VLITIWSDDNIQLQLDGVRLKPVFENLPLFLIATLIIKVVSKMAELSYDWHMAEWQN